MPGRLSRGWIRPNSRRSWATGLDPFPDRPAGKLSGGMKQKLSLCCALIHDPDLLILDEPTTGVDPLSRRQFWELIDRIRARRRGMSVIVATAYMEEAERFDWLAAMDDGRVIANGRPAELKARGNEPSLDAAFINLLPEAKRAGHQRVIVPPRSAADGLPAIEAVGLTRRFGKFTAVDHVSFRIERGEIFGFLGSNGCGKSTTMKMLTGLLPGTEGEARLFGRRLDAADMETRRRVGYMSQSFSLYSELTVHQNLELHSRLFRLPEDQREARVREMLERFDLVAVTDNRPESLPLGVRQRLQLAVAILHGPEILILDEPTSGVDPIARDTFWRYLINLSRKEGVTIFLSTHFTNEAERCDRISLMHAGKVLAVATAKELERRRGMDNLEDAFIAYLEDAAGVGADRNEEVVRQPVARPEDAEASPFAPRLFDWGRLWAYARRETMEILRDPIRLAFSLLGPIILMTAFGYGMSFDVDNLSYAVLDQDRTLESREFLEGFAGSRYFQEHREIASAAELDQRLGSGELALAIEIPPNFGKDLITNKQPEVSVWLDGANTFRAETARGYVDGVEQNYLAGQVSRGRPLTLQSPPVVIDTRFRYNQAFESVNAIVPGVIMLLLVLIPAMMTAVGVVREKETGSIANFQSTPITKLEFLLGKQMPYVAIALISFLTLLLLALFLFRVPVKGSIATLFLGVGAYLCATTGLGLLISSFTKTQVAAVFGTAILTMMPAQDFSGLLIPVSSLPGSGRAIALGFPGGWFQQISVGTFTKGLGIAALWPDILALVGFAVVFVAAAALALRKQEA
jgi:ribosome-dependent ATPase